jgi:hypothetical protein
MKDSLSVSFTNITEMWQLSIAVTLDLYLVCILFFLSEKQGISVIMEQTSVGSAQFDL